MAVEKREKDMAADLDMDGKITAKDARLVLNANASVTAPDENALQLNEKSSYTVMAEKLLDEIIEKSSSFSFDINADPIYNRYKNFYADEGMKAAKNSSGLASSLTGGYGNSYAATVAANAMKDYSDKTALKAQELTEDAYQKHLDSIDNLYSAINVLSKLNDTQKENESDILDFAVRAASYGDYSFLSDLGIDTRKLTLQELKEKAEDFADYGDYSLLRVLGVDTSGLEAEKDRDTAEFLAKYGDYSGLSELGVDLTKLNEEELLGIAKVFAQYGDYSLLNKLGADTSEQETLDYYNKLKLIAGYRNLL